MRKSWILSIGLVTTMAGCGGPDTEDVIETSSHALELASNDRGFAESFHTAGTIDRTNPFFTTNGGNGRTCETCHSPSQGWTLNPDAVTDLFNATDGLDLLFMTLDEGSRPDNDISTLAARRKAFKSTLLKHAVTRFPMAIPATAEFTVTDVKDPYGFATTSAGVIFRRPTSVANETKVAQTNWTFLPPDFGTTDIPSLLVALAIGGTAFHLQRPGLPVELAAQFPAFQFGLFFAQTYDNAAGALDTGGAKGGPAYLASQPFHVGINDIQNNDPGHPFNPKVFDIFDAWANADANPSLRGAAKKQAQARASIYRGQELFNAKKFNITGVNGLNDLLGQTTVQGTCSTCHNSPNVGGHSVVRFFDTGTANKDRCLSDYPVYTLKNKTTGAIRRVCDAGRGGVGGKWNQVGAFRAPPLRGLAGRSPYFHDGQAASIEDLVDFYDSRFTIHLTCDEKKDLGNFLEAL